MSTNRPFTTLNPKEIKSKYPKTYKSIIEWLKKSATEGNMITEEIVQAFIYGNPRFLYDYFDDMDQIIILTDEDVVAEGRKAVEEKEFEYALAKQEANL